MEIPDRKQVREAYQQRGGRVAAVFPYHYPRALFRAFDILPIEVWGPPGADLSLSASHLQGTTCSLVRAGLSLLLQGGLDVCDLIVVPHGCDSLQGLGSVLLDFVRPAKPVLTPYIPRGNKEAAIPFLADELRALAVRLAEITGRQVTDESLLEAIRREEEADRLLARLAAERGHLDLPDRATYRLLRSREYLPAEEFQGLAEEALAARSAEGRSEIPVILSGIVPEPPAILDLINQADATVVADDLCCVGRRLYPAGESEEPYRRMAQSLLSGAPDSTRGSTVESRIAHLKGLIKKSGARGVIFYCLKFCEPEQFYLPQLRAALAAAGVSSLEVESDFEEKVPQQTITRIEAFLETLQ